MYLKRKGVHKSLRSAHTSTTYHGVIVLIYVYIYGFKVMHGKLSYLSREVYVTTGIVVNLYLVFFYNI